MASPVFYTVYKFNVWETKSYMLARKFQWKEATMRVGTMHGVSYLFGQLMGKNGKSSCDDKLRPKS